MKQIYKKIISLVGISSLLLIVLIMGACYSNNAVPTSFQNQVSITIKNKLRIIESNSIPTQATGTFPNSHNPNTVSPQDISVSLPTNPQKGVNVIAGNDTTEGSGYEEADLSGAKVIGITIEGVLMEPGTAERWDPISGQRVLFRAKDTTYEWAYDGLGNDRTGSFVGMDKYKAHVQPSGTYHYHAISSYAQLYSDATNTHSELVAFAADGFPIFGPYGYLKDDITIGTMYGNYRLKNNGGARSPINGQNPEENYDGTFVEDYEFAAGNGDVDHLENGTQTSILDHANGHVGKVPAFELDKYGGFDQQYLGTKNSDNTYTVYHYHLTDNFPYMPRKFYGSSVRIGSSPSSRTLGSTPPSHPPNGSPPPKR